MVAVKYLSRPSAGTGRLVVVVPPLPRRLVLPGSAGGDAVGGENDAASRVY